MKASTLSMRIKNAWPALFQPLLSLLAVVVGVASFVLVASGKSKSTKTPEGPPPTILMVGDSLSVGKFGEVVQDHLERKYRVAAYAFCGSSPEHWLSSEPDFVTKCGYREHFANTDVLRDFVNGRPPRPKPAPKLAKLISRHKPTILIAQLGTNWMDRSLTDEQMSGYLDQFVREARRGAVEQIIWIAPPDSARLRRVQGRVYKLLSRAAMRKDFQIIDSRAVTHYIMGKTGGDGVHYNSESSAAWARGIQRELDANLELDANEKKVREKKFSQLTRDEPAGN